MRKYLGFYPISLPVDKKLHRLTTIHLQLFTRKRWICSTWKSQLCTDCWNTL